jgi:hypothetical protein
MSDQTTASGQRDTKDAARQEARQVQGTTKDAASNVAGTAKERGQDVRRQAEHHVRGIVGETTEQLRGHARDETQRAGGALQSAGSQLQALADGRVEDAGVFAEYAQQAADTVNRWAETMQQRGFDGLLNDLRSFGSRRPGMYLLSAVAAGVVVSRFGRNAAQELRSGGDGSGTQALPSSSSDQSTTSRGQSGDDDVIVGTSSRVGDASEPGARTRPAETAERDDTAAVRPASGGSADDVIVERTSGDVVIEDPDSGEQVSYQPNDVEQRSTQ